ncbi:MAG: HAMP domain-containing histidine kinase [Gemmatimonadota bacterium]|nr:HAMP domain-containing histidine kinase [Gemmatimonadota bacterium]
MRFRTRIFLSIFAAALIPIALLAYGVRREMSSRLEGDARERADAVTRAVGAELGAAERAIRDRLATYTAALAADNGFRLAVVAGDPGERRALIDWAPAAMRASGLDLLRVQDAEGRILSSGHFRNEYDRLEPLLPRALADGEPAVARVRGPSESLLALVAGESFSVGGRSFAVVGGMRLDSAGVAALSRDPGIDVTLLIPGSRAPRGETVATISLPFLDAVASHADTARFIVTRDVSGLAELRRRVDLWVAAALGATLLLSLVLAAWLASRIARPISELAEKTALVDLDRLDQRFGSDRDDEVGALANLLDAMTIRLRRSTASLREAERRAATGDLARQVNHDIKNGLAPIRHVLRHLTQVAEREPAALAQVYGERRGTLESSVEYLEGLAREYAKLSPSLDRAVCRPETILRDAAAAVQAPDRRVELHLAADTPAVRADAVVLRRVVNNLVTNAVDALDGRPGTVTLTSAAAGDHGAPVARLTVADTGRGMTRDELDRAFQDFYTTKPAGTGLGLSVVRRLVNDLGGTIRVETVPGQGTRFIVDLPAEPRA